MTAPNFNLEERNRALLESLDPIEWGRSMVVRLRKVAQQIRDHRDEGIYIWRSDAESLARLIERLIERAESLK